MELGKIASDYTEEIPRDLTFLAPVQQAGNALSVAVGNVEDETSVFDWIGYSWLPLLALIAWAYAWISGKQRWTLIGWVLLAWGALRWPNGARAFLVVLALFFVVRLAIPALRRLWRSPRKPKPTLPDASSGAAATAVSLLIAGLVSFEQRLHLRRTQRHCCRRKRRSRRPSRRRFGSRKSSRSRRRRSAGSAVKGQRLPLLFEPAVLTKRHVSERRR